VENKVTDHERTHHRSLIYSVWHRTNSVGRFVEDRKAYLLAMIDLDAIEYCRSCGQPLAFLELAYGNGDKWKAATVMTKLAMAQGRPAFVVYYLSAETSNPADPSVPDIKEFRVRQMWPKSAKQHLVTMTPKAYAEWLWSFRNHHRCSEMSSAAQLDSAGTQEWL